MIDGSLLELPARVVHVWTICLADLRELEAGFEAILSMDEKERAARLRFPDHRLAFLITRGTLRCLLARYVERPAADLRFQYGPRGKPLLESAGELEFNVAHSGSFAAFAFTRGCRIGVDIELIRPLEDMQTIAGRYFCREETEEILSLPPQEREAAFFHCWTRKEAYIKATGDGLAMPLDEFRVTTLPQEPARLVGFSPGRGGAGPWSLHDLDLASGYAAAAAYEDERRTLCVLPIPDAARLLG